MKDKKKKVIIGTSISVFLLILLGISYAFLRNKIYGSKGKIVYHTSGLDVVLEEDSTPSLELTGAVPMSDEDGLKSDKVYRFTVVNRSSSNLKYKVYLDNDNEALKECGDTCEFIPDRDIKYEIKKDQSSINTLENRELADGRLVKGGRETYELKLWINSEAENEIVGKYFFGKIRVEVVQDYNNPKEPKLASNMIPVRYDGSNWVKASKNNWYDYEKQEWANAVTIDKDKVLDLSGNNNHGTINGAIISNGEANFDGIDDYVDCGLDNYDFQNQISFVIRIKLNNSPTTLNYEMIGNWDSAGGGLAIQTNRKIWFNLYSEETTSYAGVSSNQQLEVGVYYTIVGTYDGNYMRIYINGQKDIEKQINFTIKESSMPIYTGANPNPDGTQNPSNVKVTDALIFDKRLSDEEIKSSYGNEVSLGSTKPLFYYNFKQGENISNNTIIPMDLINTMWVWIPRYSYTIGSEDGTNYYGKQGDFLDSTPTQALPGEIDVKFVDKNTKDRGSAKYKVSDGVSGWYTPDAFTFGNEELEGIWVGKFETSNKENNFSDNDTLTPIIKPKVTSWRNIKVSTLENVALKMNKDGNIYGFVESEVDTHAAKGSEWALVTYLSQSRYGKLGNRSYTGANKEIYMNAYTGYRTGCSYGEPTFPNSSGEQTCSHDYDEIEDRGEGKGAVGAGASTTGNIYGIYDMNGGSSEYVMSNFNGYTGNTESQNSGYNGLLTDGSSYDKGIPYPNEKYYDKYVSSSINLISHAMGETVGWNGDAALMVNSTYPWQIRGGIWRNVSSSGLFYFAVGSAGGIDGMASFRLVLLNL